MILLVAAMIGTFFRKRRMAISFIASAIVFTLLAGFSNFGAVLIAPLENRFERAVLPDGLDTILVLGGSTYGRISAARGVTELNSAGDRFMEAVTLAQRFPQAKIVFSGGSGLLVPEIETEAESAERLFVQLGIDRSRLVLEGRSRNTAENAAFTANVLKDSRNIALVTSAFHMPRSVGLFRAQGVEVFAWPTDYQGSGNERFGLNLDDPALNLEVLTVAMREWIGLVAYKLTGRIGDILPAPRQ
ncbi:YdcF family protein [Devosia sp. MC1541]|uniref:YdcF family protein n=1 Tax=Devosia sp. MC1541 TaxID=2725264 RepID=UPI0020BDAEE9|nr:YdcF family protein [Devosia sp. MC1541]